MKKRVLSNSIVAALCCGLLAGCSANAVDEPSVGGDWKTSRGYISEKFTHDGEVDTLVWVGNDGISIYLNQDAQVEYQKIMFPYVTTDEAKTTQTFATGDYNGDGYTDISVDLVNDAGESETVQWIWSAEESAFTVNGEVADVSDDEDEKPEVYLKDVFGEHGLKVGTCLTTRMISNDIASKRITDQFTSITMENEMKPDYLFNKTASKEAGQLVVEFSDDAIKMLDWALANNMAVRGHTLVWYSQTPSWIFYEDFDTTKSLVSEAVMIDRMESYIKQVFELLDEKGYLDIIYAYDVVNEAWMEDGSIREENNYWYKTMGEDFLYYAFYFADMYAPESVDLYYNDYNEQFKANTLVSFVETLKDENGRYLIDGVGLQAHLYTSDDLSTYFNAMDTIAATGLKIQLTELDVSLGAWQNTLPPTEENLQKQGRFYYNLINGIFERVDNGTISCDALTFWGYVDSMSWRSSAYPLLFDSVYQPKYAFYGAAQLKEYAGF